MWEKIKKYVFGFFAGLGAGLLFLLSIIPALLFMRRPDKSESQQQEIKNKTKKSKENVEKIKDESKQNEPDNDIVSVTDNINSVEL